ncbi:hypothetical protein J4220_02435 [Candidatus Micrarchaeota archaeon]|nr:hypothetical protein [Candidatus Micrarchaeota archaeon]
MLDFTAFASLLSIVPVFIFSDFMDALTLIIIILDFVMLYKYIYPEMVSSQIVGIVITTVITFLLIIPYAWFAWLVFGLTVAYSFFWGFKPWTWATDKKEREDEEGP